MENGNKFDQVFGILNFDKPVVSTEPYDNLRAADHSTVRANPIQFGDRLLSPVGYILLIIVLSQVCKFLQKIWKMIVKKYQWVLLSIQETNKSWNCMKTEVMETNFLDSNKNKICTILIENTIVINLFKPVRS